MEEFANFFSPEAAEVSTKSSNDGKKCVKASCYWGIQYSVDIFNLYGKNYCFSRDCVNIRNPLMSYLTFSSSEFNFLNVLEAALT